MAIPLVFNVGGSKVQIRYADGVLHPSPFSMLLAEALVERLATGELASTGPALDVGSGSGLQAILLAKNGIPEVYAVDIDPRCVSATEFNALLNDVSEWRDHRPVVYAHLGDLLEPVGDLRFGLIVANPPTLPASDDTPRFASGGSYPQEILDRIVAQSSERLLTNGKLLVVVSSLAGIPRTITHMQSAGLTPRIVACRDVLFRDFYYRHIAQYRRLKLQGVSDFQELETGELVETVCVIEGLKSE